MGPAEPLKLQESMCVHADLNTVAQTAASVIILTHTRTHTYTRYYNIFLLRTCLFGLAIGERCYEDTGVHYRGTANVTISGAPCLPWNSDVMYNELTVDTMDGAVFKGLGDHAFCRLECIHL